MTSENEEKINKLIALYDASYGAFSSIDKQALIFAVTNDTIQLAHYDRAILWNITNKKVRPLCISGVANMPYGGNHFTETWKICVEGIKSQETQQVLNKESFSSAFSMAWNQLASSENNQEVLWMPIFKNEKGNEIVGLWLERWQGKKWNQSELAFLEILSKSYHAAWNRWEKVSLMKKILKKPIILTLIIMACITSILVNVPLRVVSPCEVAPKSPIMITAPQDGVIEEVKVHPGDHVKKNDLLFSYDKRLPMQQYKASKKQVEIAESELKRVLAMSMDNQSMLQRVTTLKLRVEREKIIMERAKMQMEQLEVRAVREGIVVIQNVEEWRGKPVHIGEQILTISNPQTTKITMWIPENDNVVFSKDKEIKIFLNIHPEKSIRAHLSYIANQSMVNEKGIYSFFAEAEWDEEPGLHIGLKGTAILYGKNVPLLYWILRRPIGAIRQFLGI